MSRRILLVEDEQSIVLALTKRLESEGYRVAHVADGEAATRIGADDTFHLIILDLMLPKKNGIDVCRDLRAAGVDTPILMLTARSQTADKVIGLKIGADDYLTKPFETAELLARVETLLRRVPRGPGAVEESDFRFGDVAVNFRSAEVERAGEPVYLSALEYNLLRYFIDHRGELVSRERLLDEVWGYDATPYTRTVDQRVASLRQKLETNPSKPAYITTVHGLGYKFVG